MGKFRQFCEKLFSGSFRPLFTVKEQQAVQCITAAMLGSILFSIVPSPSFAQLRRADLILINGKVRTLDPAKPSAEAIAIAGGRIISVGSNSQVRLLADDRTQVIDAKGRLVVPGFNDAHVHFAAIGNKFSSIDLKSARSQEEAADRMREYARFLPKGRWILGGGLYPELFTAGDGKLKRLVDAVTPFHPVFVYFTDPKRAFANAAALSRLADRRASGGPNAEKLLKEPAGNDGLLTGAGLALVASLVPNDHVKNWPEILETASNYAASLGVTSVQDMHSDELAVVYRELDRQGKLKTRIYDCSPISAVPRLAAEGVKAASGTAMVRTGCVKTLSEGDAADAARLRREITAADNAGLQVMVHAIGPRANAMVLDAFESAVRENGRRDRRFRVEHAQGVSDTDMQRFARSGVIASMQPWLFRGSSAELFSRHLRLRTRIALGSDASIVEFEPLFGISAASGQGGGAVVEEVVRAYTVGSAYAEFQEHIKGTITPGKLADIVILSDNVFESDAARIRNVTVLITIVNGEVVFEDRAKLGAFGIVNSE
jgi:predicted amidohydrolase YtcJ